MIIRAKDRKYILSKGDDIPKINGLFFLAELFGSLYPNKPLPKTNLFQGIKRILRGLKEFFSKPNFKEPGAAIVIVSYGQQLYVSILIKSMEGDRLDLFRQRSVFLGF